MNSDATPDPDLNRSGAGQATDHTGDPQDASDVGPRQDPKNKRKQRRANDAYYTPSWCVHRLLEVVPSLSVSRDQRYSEPFAGGGSIVHAVSAFREMKGLDVGFWWSRDIAQTGVSTMDIDIPDYHDKSIIISNPPYNLAQEAVEWALRQNVHSVYYLLRLNFLASAKRHKLFRENMPSIYVIPNRPSFTDDGRTDAIEYAWFRWDLVPQLPRVYLLDTTPREDRIER